MRLILFLALLFLCYYAVKILSSQLTSKRKEADYYGKNGTTASSDALVDELVKDPICGVYIPKKDAIVLKLKGKYYYFCSHTCKDAFLSSLKKSPN
ncbi:hypothetical protein DBT_0044 [Dissulfuribacter thermophilus]|uniref:TRASH domain-containing protein n=1 Tax=Dissulfuribacter thermophilus TaxID=1156395 RepID=A0A1B9F8G8_9BACT|nr:YHS domain-containing protein [Dissulfuribacter thermophilus]OCC16227.1 hypothetical protein DBT_0044 [Dissulfuribacter thermophilus]